MEGTTSLPILYLSWWYGYAYGRLFKYIRAFFIINFDLFSVKVCITTLFSPWKRDLINYEGLTLQEKFKAWTLNLASRFTGFIIKLMTLFSYLVSSIFTLAGSIIMVIAWPLVPVLAVYLIIRGIRAF